MHIERHRRGGLELEASYPNRGRRERLLDFLNSTVLPHRDASACLEWPFSFDAYGYALASLEGRRRLVYNYVCEKVHGPKPDDKDEAAHSCGNKPCVNPMHIRWATFKENAADRLEHNGGRCFPTSKLTKEQVAEIRGLRGKESQSSIAKRMNVSQTNISMVMRGATWAWTDHQPSASNEGLTAKMVQGSGSST